MTNSIQDVLQYQFPILVILLISAFLVVLIYVLPRLERFREWLVVAVLGVSTFTILLVLFSTTPFGLNAYGGDQSYVIAAIEKYKYFSSFVDFNYANLHIYYPPLYFYILGKAAYLFSIPAYTAVKDGFIGAGLVLPFLMFSLWKPTIGKKPALVVTVLVQFALFDLFKTYEFAATSLLLPWWLLFTRKELSKTRWFFGSLIGALLFQTYYYCFFILIISLVVQVVWNFFEKNPDWKRLVRQLTLLIGTGILSSYYWLPVIVQSFTVGYQNFQNDWISPNMISIEFFKQLMAPTIWTWIMLFGFVYLVIFYRKDNTQKTLFQLLLACYVWYLIGLLGIWMHAFNLFIKAWPFNDYLLLVGFSVGLYHLLEKEKLKPFRSQVYGLTLVVAFLTLGDIWVQSITDGNYYQVALSTTSPPSSMQELSDISNLKGKVFLTDQDSLVEFYPVYSFLGENLNYANPAASYNSRVQFLTDIEKVQDPLALAWFYQYNRFGKIDYIWAASNTLTYTCLAPDYQTGYRHLSLSTVYEHAPEFTRIGSTDVYAVNPVPKDAYKTFNTYELQIAYEFAKINR